ncbi:MAG: tyrosine--tRNA ligase [Candidatus Lambdaproteobacteria bacterium]|nr:tyrosine--tRNA ligase [Candidatus Lambdaproteobacteria bacterium]
MTVWDTFRERGFFQQCTDAAALEKQGAEGPLTGYIGFDPTADSFHVGHLIPIMALLHFQRAGNRPIALVGGGTALIGDPTGKNEMRKMLTEEELARNIAGLKAQLARLLDFGSGSGSAGATGALLVNNADWLRGLNYIDFLRDVGLHFSVNRMLTFETFRTRLEGAGLSFIEFNYPLLQSYDFLELHRRHGCLVQMGGDDQWANIVSGVDLVRRMARAQVFGWTFPLLTTASGAKMGKTEQGAVWLDPARTSPYEYYQFWVNLDDADVPRCLALFTLLPMDEVQRWSVLKGGDLRSAKHTLAFEQTKLIHGEAEARKAQAGAQALFGGAMSRGGDLAAAPSTTLAADRLRAGLPVAELLAEVGLARSRSDARRLIEQGGVTLNERRVDDVAQRVDASHLAEGALLLRVGKKKFRRVVVEG